MKWDFSRIRRVFPMNDEDLFLYMLRNPLETRAEYIRLIDFHPVVGTAQMACELLRRRKKGLHVTIGVNEDGIPIDRFHP